MPVSTTVAVAPTQKLSHPATVALGNSAEKTVPPAYTVTLTLVKMYAVRLTMESSQRDAEL